MRLPYQKLVWAFIFLQISTNGIARALPVSSVNELDRRAGGGGGGHGNDHPTTGGGHGTGVRPEDGPGGTGAATGGEGTTGGYHDETSETTGGFGEVQVTAPKENTPIVNDRPGQQNQHPACIVKRALSGRGECFAPDGTAAKTPFGPKDQERLDASERVVLENGKTPRSNAELDAAYQKTWNEKWSKPYDTGIDPRISQEGGLQKVFDQNYKADRDVKDARIDQGDSKYIADAGLLKLGKDSSGKDVSIKPESFQWGRYAVRSKANGKSGGMSKTIFVDPEEAALVCKVGIDKANQRMVIVAEQKAQKFDTNRYQTDNRGGQIFKNGKPQLIDDAGKTEAAQFLPNSELAFRSALKELKAAGVPESEFKKYFSEVIIVQQQVINMETQAIENRIFKELATSMDNRVFLTTTEPADKVWINRLEMSDNVKPGDNMRWSHPEYFGGSNPQELKDFWITADTKTGSGGVYSTIFFKYGYQY